MQIKRYLSEYEVSSLLNLKLEVCIRGAGVLAEFFLEAIEKTFNISISYMVDKNEKTFISKCGKRVECIKPSAVEPGTTACIIMVGDKNQETVGKEMENLGYKPVFLWKSICKTDYIKSIFQNASYHNETIFQDAEIRNAINIKNVATNYSNLSSKSVVYTCITGNYDDFIEPKDAEKGIDYYIISEVRPKNLRLYKWIDIHDVITDRRIDDIRKNRICKLNPHKLFPDYEYSLYHDGNMRISGCLNKYFESLNKKKCIALCRHPNRHNVFEEASEVIALKKDDPNTVISQIQYYVDKGFPVSDSLFACGVIVSKHNEAICKKIMNDWCNEVKTFSYRDQLSLPYVLWKNDADNLVETIEEDIYKLDGFKIKEHIM